MEIINKKISIIGAVRSGLTAAKLAKELGAVVFVSDSSSKEKLETNLAVLDELKIEYEVSEHSEKIFDCDFMIVSPGVPENSYPIMEAKKRNIKIYSEVEFASWFCKATIISITGTNGKTTTTELISYILNKSNKKCVTAGNIGVAFSEIVYALKDDEFVSLETSSFQLDHIKNFKPKFSILLNITPDHMDRYENNLELYKKSKLASAKNQSANDIFIFNADDPSIQVDEIKSQKYSFSLRHKVDSGCYWENDKIYFVDDNKKEKVAATGDFIIKGEHNIANAMAAVIVAKLIGCDNSSIEKSLHSFPGVEHRIEFVREINGIKFYNDSKATNVDSVWFALKSFDRPIYLILGGKDKGNDYRQIEELIRKNVKKIYAIGSSANKVYEFFKNIIEVEYKQSLKDCVEAANKEADKGDVVLLSPACASFDMFDNYEHRGKVFKEAVRRL